MTPKDPDFKAYWNMNTKYLNEPRDQLYVILTLQYQVNFNVTLITLSKDEEKTKELIKI